MGAWEVWLCLIPIFVRSFLLYERLCSRMRVLYDAFLPREEWPLVQRFSSNLPPCVSFAVPSHSLRVLPTTATPFVFLWSATTCSGSLLVATQSDLSLRSLSRPLPRCHNISLHSCGLIFPAGESSQQRSLPRFLILLLTIIGPPSQHSSSNTCHGHH